MYRSVLISILLIAVSFCVMAQNLDKQKPAYISIKDGLPDATITAICQDADGFLWIGTSYGLSRYDGVEFRNYFHNKTANSLPGNYIRALQILPGDRLLIATTSGLSLLNISTNRFKNFVVQTSGSAYALQNSFITINTDSDGDIWAGSQTCLYELDTALHVLQLRNGYKENDIDANSPIYVEAIKRLPGGDLLFTLPNKKVDRYQLYQPGTKKIMPLNNTGLVYKQIFTTQGVADIVFDKDGNAWYIKHLVDSLFFFDRVLNKVTAAPLDSIKGKNQIYYNSHISLINDNLVGCSLSDGGLLYVNKFPSADKAQILKTGIALPGKHVQCTFYDRQHNLWIGTTNGLYKFTLAANHLAISTLPQYNPADGRNIELAGIFVTGGKVFITTTSGGIFFSSNNGADWKNFSWRTNTDVNDTWNIRQLAAGDYWVGTQLGLFTWRPGNNTAAQLPLPAGWGWINTLPITTQFVDKENILWMGLGKGNGVAAYNLASRDIKLYTGHDESKFPLRYPMTIDEDEHGDLWMGGVEGKGLVWWNRKTNLFTTFPPAPDADFDNGIINAIYADHKGSLWLGTDGGLFKFNISAKKFKKYDVPQGLSSNIVYSVAADGAAHLWIGTKNGISCMDIVTGKIFNFSGYYQASDDAVYCVRYQSALDKIDFITPHDFYSINPNEWLKRRNAPQLFITSATSSGKSVDPGHKILLGYGSNNINIAFTAVNLVDGSQNKYFYRLNNQEWVSAGGNRQANFSNLLPGRYTFNVKAQLADGTWSENEGVVSFTVATPFWKTWLFITPCIVVLAFLIYMAYQYRIRQIMHLQAIRSRIASDLHDDIGSTLSNIHILTQLSHANLSEPEKADTFLTRIAEEVDASNQSLDDIVWSINVLNDSFEQTAARMRRYAAELFEGANIQYKVFFDEKLSQKKLNMEFRRDVYLIFKEAVNNIYKHAGASSVTINLEADHRYFKMTVTDDGRGFDPLAPTTRNGLKNMEARVKNRRGIFKVKSAKGGGATLYIAMSVFR